MTAETKAVRSGAAVIVECAGGSVVPAELNLPFERINAAIFMVSSIRRIIWQ